MNADAELQKREYTERMGEHYFAAPRKFRTPNQIRAQLSRLESDVEQSEKNLQGLKRSLTWCVRLLRWKKARERRARVIELHMWTMARKHAIKVLSERLLTAKDA